MSRSFRLTIGSTKEAARATGEMVVITEPWFVLGAGLPFLAVGYGVYWLVKRRRKVN